MTENNGVVDKGDWFKVHHSGWLEGSLRAKQDIPIEIIEDGDKLAAYRGVQADLLALISRSRLRDGTLRHAEGIPMQRQWIANVLNISLNLLNAVIDDGLHDMNKEGNHTRIEVWEDGTIEFTNWSKYQAKSGKTVAQKIAIAKAKETRKSMDNAVVGLTRAINEQTKATDNLKKKIRYIPDQNGNAVDIVTGEIKEKE